MRFQRRLSPLQACGCYIAVALFNIVVWGALIVGAIKLIKWAWGG